MNNDAFEVDTKNLDEKIEIEKFIQMLLLSADVEGSVSSNSQFVEPVGKLSQLRLDEVASIPQRIQKEEENLRHKTEQLAVENYPIFLANANTSREVHREFISISDSNGNLLSSIARVSSVAQTIFDNIGKNASAFRTSAKSVQNYTQVSEFLELPQLMETCIQNGYYQDALNILNHTKQLAKKYGRMIPIVRMVGLQAQEISGQLFSHLCKQLRQPITLPVCLKVVIYLRQLEVFSEQELRLNFLQSRGICIKDQMEIALAKPIGIMNFDPKLANLTSYQQSEYKAFIRTMRRIEVTRVQLFDSITQYRAIFADDESCSSKLSDPQQQPVLADISPLHLDETARMLRYLTTNRIADIGPCTEASLFHAWLVRQVGIFLDGLSDDLSILLNLPRFTPAEISDRIQLAMANDAVNLDNVDASTTFQQIHSVMTQALYFGRSFARIGCDFRAHLGIIFTRHIFTYLETLLRNASTELSVVLDLWPWEPVEPYFLVSQSGESNPGEVQAPLEIARYPAIAFFCNRILSAFNGLRICCPIALRDGVLSLSVRTLSDAANAIVSAHKTRQLDSSTARTQSVRLASVFAHVATPHLLTCLLEHIFGGDAAFHLWQLHQDSGETLATSQYVSRIAKEVCAPIFAVWGQLAHGPLPIDQPIDLDLMNRKQEPNSQEVMKQELKLQGQTTEFKSLEPPVKAENHQLVPVAPLIDSSGSNVPAKDIPKEEIAATTNTPAEDKAEPTTSTGVEQESPKSSTSIEDNPPNIPTIATVQPSTVHEDAEEIPAEERKLSTEEKLQVLTNENEDSNETVKIEKGPSELKGDPFLLERGEDASSRMSGFGDSVQLIGESLDEPVVPVESSSKDEEKTTEQLSESVSALVVPSCAEKTSPLVKESQVLAGTMAFDLKGDQQHEKLANLVDRLSDEDLSPKNNEQKVSEGDVIIQSDQISTLPLPLEEVTPVIKLSVGNVEAELLEKEGITDSKQFIDPLSSDSKPVAGEARIIDAKDGSSFPTHEHESLSGPQSPEPSFLKGSEIESAELGADVCEEEQRPPTKSGQIIENPFGEDIKSSAPDVDDILTLNAAPDSTPRVKPVGSEGKSDSWNVEGFGEGVLPTDVNKKAPTSELKLTADEVQYDDMEAEDKEDERLLTEPGHPEISVEKRVDGQNSQEIATDFISVANAIPLLKPEETDEALRERDYKEPIEQSSFVIDHSIKNKITDVSNEEATDTWDNGGDDDHSLKIDMKGTVQEEPSSMPIEGETLGCNTMESNSVGDSFKLETSHETYKIGLAEMEEVNTEENHAEKPPEQTELIFAFQNDPIEIEAIQVRLEGETMHSKPEARKTDKEPSGLSEALLEEIVDDKRDSNGSLSAVPLRPETPEASKVIKVDEGNKSPIEQRHIEGSKVDEDAWKMKDGDAWNENADSEDKLEEGEKDTSSQNTVDNYLKAYHSSSLVGSGEPSDFVTSSGSMPKLGESEVICNEDSTKSPTKTFSPIESPDDAWSDRDRNVWNEKEEISSNSPGITSQDADTTEAILISKQVIESELPKSDFELNANNSNAALVETQASRGFFGEVDSLNLEAELAVNPGNEWRDNAKIDTGDIVETEEPKVDIKSNMEIPGSIDLDAIETTTGFFSDNQNIEMDNPDHLVKAVEPPSLSSSKESLSEKVEEESMLQKEALGDNSEDGRARETGLDVEDSEARKNLSFAESKEFRVGIKSNMEPICPLNLVTVEAEIENLSEQQDAKIEASNYRLKSDLLEPSIAFPSKKQQPEEEEGMPGGPKEGPEEMWKPTDLEAKKSTPAVGTEDSNVDVNANIEVPHFMHIPIADTAGILTGSLTEKHDLMIDAPNSQMKSEILKPSNLLSPNKQHSEEEEMPIVQGNTVEPDDTWGDDGNRWGEVTEIEVGDLEIKKNVDVEESKELEADIKVNTGSLLTFPDTVEKQNIKLEASDYLMKPELIEPSTLSSSKRLHFEKEEKPDVRESPTEADDVWGDEGNGWNEDADIEISDLGTTKTISFAETGGTTDGFNVPVESHRLFNPTNPDTTEIDTGTSLENKDAELEATDDRIIFGTSEFVGVSVPENQHFKETEESSLDSKCPPVPTATWNDDNGTASTVDVKFDEGVLKDSEQIEPEIKEHGPLMVSHSEPHSSNADVIGKDTRNVALEDSAWDEDDAWGEDHHQTEPVPQESDSIPLNPAEKNIPEKLEFDFTMSMKRDVDEKAEELIESGDWGDDENAWGDDAELPLGEIEAEKSTLDQTSKETGGLAVPVSFQTGFEDTHSKDDLELLPHSEANSTGPGSNLADIGNVLKDPPKEAEPDEQWDSDF
ncbi:hypothetical protein Aperf_G00000016988 [Anoplocephala perfoliata]